MMTILFYITNRKCIVREVPFIGSDLFPWHASQPRASGTGILELLGWDGWLASMPHIIVLTNFSLFCTEAAGFLAHSPAFGGSPARKRKMEDVPTLVETLSREGHLLHVVVIYLGGNHP